ncbi:PREDICTED: protein CURVATURE THYLAKOID 1C, chloroplastic isoform X3 [Nicotiana attenuata]|uniref:protein CURVATURE THYLAKOID 1C, chloroplastic isoform X3 n=1 Tax=Nicotiana attenuata TaxID=49451 RepID=UPI0009052172|nr:PREDICTED: protein CURVATURE THYLAKOID 1C, chloroplastic isoform X3 [Nicotiana attenuata]
MASVVAKLNPPPLAISGRQFLFGTVQTSTLSIPRTRQGHLAITAKATSESSESSSVVQSLKNIWDKPEDRVAVIGFGIAAIVGFWASSNLIAVCLNSLGYCFLLGLYTDTSYSSPTAIFVFKRLQILHSDANIAWLPQSVDSIYTGVQPYTFSCLVHFIHS